MNTPKTISDLRYQYHVISVLGFSNVQKRAKQFFKKAGLEGRVKVNHLFTEDGKRVFESYVDSGSVDYLYIIQ